MLTLYYISLRDMVWLRCSVMQLIVGLHKYHYRPIGGHTKRVMRLHTDKAYIAGLVDGEGCIAIARRKIKRLSSNNWYYEPVIIVANTDKRMVDFLVSCYSGYVAMPKRQKDNHKQQYHWKITGDSMRQLLREIFPYLITKKKQAEIVLSFPVYNETGKLKIVKPGGGEHDPK